MDIFLTGGSGFVGQHMITRLVADGHTVRALARSPESARRVEQAGATAVLGDLADLHGPDPAGRPASTRPAPAWLSALDGCDVVVHAAARMAFWGPDAGFEQDNHRPTVALYTAAAAAGVGRFVLVSAAAVSTDRRRGPAVVSETTPTGRPLIAYGRVKLATERALAGLPTPGTTLVVLRPPLIWGPGMTTLTEAARAAAAGQFAWIDGGRHVIDFVHVTNLAAATSAALTRGRDRGVYYVTDGSPMPIRDLFTPLFGAAGADVSRARSVPSAVAVPVAALLDGVWRLLRRPTPPPLDRWLVAVMGRDRSYDISRARAELGYRPGVTVAAGLAELRGSGSTAGVV
ncbi:NAD-dependent epimerase/dehydratase family protein [Promicromonospora sp. NPDC050880]|uniref:NAD-dependent epimerase/dehydratase family protein n=1 Tax=Promicromonospora sp. NPDC050880 TaxID=3364406 RepID=UPI00378DB150